MSQHLVDWGPGFRFFKCTDCGQEWKSVCRDCTSPSGETCGNCNQFIHPHEYEKHYEWKTHRGNLIQGEKYE